MMSLSYLIYPFLLSAIIVVCDFNKSQDISNWYVVDDGVMGGRSQGDFILGPSGNGVFKGDVSLENNGGFSSVRYGFEKIAIPEFEKVVLNIKGDGKRYQFRLRANGDDYYSYITYFETTGDWQVIEIPLNELYPTFRGRKLDLPNFPGNTMEEIGFLIANATAESFKLEINMIELR